jgi:hypothetical protein
MTVNETSWAFLLDQDQRWRWERHSGPGSEVERSTGYFRTLAECLLDARANGYSSRPDGADD